MAKGRYSSSKSRKAPRKGKKSVRSASKSRSKSSVGSIKALRSKKTGNIIGYGKMKMVNGKRAFRFLPSSQWPKNVNKAQIKADNLKNLHGAKRRSKSKSKSRKSKSRSSKRRSSYKPLTKTQAQRLANEYVAKRGTTKGMRKSMKYPSKSKSASRKSKSRSRASRSRQSAALKKYWRSKRSDSHRKKISRSRSRSNSRSKSRSKSARKPVRRVGRPTKRSESMLKYWRSPKSDSHRRKLSRSGKSKSLSHKRRSLAAKKAWRKRKSGSR